MPEKYQLNEQEKYRKNLMTIFSSLRQKGGKRLSSYVSGIPSNIKHDIFMAIDDQSDGSLLQSCVADFWKARLNGEVLIIQTLANKAGVTDRDFEKEKDKLPYSIIKILQ